MKRTELSRASGIHPETIRYYEKVGLIPAPTRTEANYRKYDSTHEEQLRFIQSCRQMDMSIDEIRMLTDLQAHPEASCEPVNVLLDKHLADVALKIKQLRKLEEQLRDLREQCGGDHHVENCAILHSIGK